MQFQTDNLSDYSSLQVLPKKESRTLKEESVHVNRKAFLPQGYSSVHLSLLPHSATRPVVHRGSLVSTQLVCPLILQDKKVKQNGRVTSMYIAYAHLIGIYVFFKSKQKTDTMTLDHSAMSTNAIFGNMQTTSLTFTSTSLTPAVLPYSLQAMFTVTSSSVSQPWPHMLAPYVLSQLLHILPHTLSLMSLTCLWPTDQTWGSTHIMTGSEPNVQQPLASQTHFWWALSGCQGSPSRGKGWGLPLSPADRYYGLLPAANSGRAFRKILHKGVSWTEEQ